MGFSVRMYCYSPSGQLLSVPMALASALAGIKGNEENKVAIPSFANCTIRFAQFVIELAQRKPCRLSTESYYVYRFNEDGMPDSKRYIQDTLDALSASHTSQLAEEVVDARSVFVARGRFWTPTSTEKLELHRTALGEVKVPRLAWVELRTPSAYT